jgi:hypothetical protein
VGIEEDRSEVTLVQNAQIMRINLTTFEITEKYLFALVTFLQ